MERFAAQCKLCKVPFVGLRGWTFRVFFRVAPFRKNPNICNRWNEKMPLGRGVRLPITVLFADVRGFTGLAERQDPHVTVDLLNKYFATAFPVLLRHDGCIDKLLGDSIMAVFGAPILRSDHAQQAVRAAIELQEALGSMPGLEEPLRIGVGVHSGTAVVANVGDPHVRDFTAIGDTVNVAARLQSIAQPGEVLVTAPVYEQVAQDFPDTPARQVKLEGRTEPVTVYRLRGWRWLMVEQTLRQIHFLAQVAEADLRLLAQHAALRRYKIGQIIFHQGDAPSALYLLRQGRARVFLLSDKGAEVTLAMLGPGDHFGEMGVLDGEPRSASVQAMEDTEAVTLGRETVLRFLREHSDAALSVCVSLAQRLRQADERLAETLFFPLASRLARTLLALAAQTGSSEVRLTQEALAAMVGASRQRVNEALGVWAQREWIRRRRGKIVLVRPQALKALDKEPIP